MSKSPFKLICIVGARPNFMKIAPIMRAFGKHEAEVELTLVHTGQHYDVQMNEQYFQALQIPAPHVNLEVGSGTHAVQTAEVMKKFEPILEGVRPTAVLVVGDVNSTLACALVAAKQNVPVIHVEAGLRSFDKAMPEEINRILTDQISTLLFTTEEKAAEHLCREGIPAECVHFVGNVMIDTLLHSKERAVPAQETLARAGYPDRLKGGRYAVLTLHRPANVDDPAVLAELLQSIVEISRDLPVLFPVHPRTASKISEFGLDGKVAEGDVLLLPPQGYLEMLGLMSGASIVLTDSGGVQEETTALGVPCFTLRPNTERPITIEQGTNILVGTNAGAIADAFNEFKVTGGKAGRVPHLWDGRAAERIADTTLGWMRRGRR